MAAALKQHTTPIWLPEQGLPHDPGAYLNSSEQFGTFSVFVRDRVAGTHKQSSYLLRELPSVLPEVLASTGPNHDVYISQAEFSRRNRRKVNFLRGRACFLDLDVYNLPGFENLSPDAMRDRLLHFCWMQGLPEPSAIVFSGRGFYVKWLLSDVVPSYALPRWDAVQHHLHAKFTAYGADNRALDCSRVLRLVGSTHPSTGEKVRVLWPEGGAIQRFYAFDELANTVLPYTRSELQDLRDHYDREYPEFERKAPAKPKATKAKGKVTSLLSVQRLTAHSLNWTRLHDMKRLIELRGGDVGEGRRELAAFFLCNQYALTYCQSPLIVEKPLEVWNEFYGLCREAAPHWTPATAKDKVSNVFRLMQEATAGQKIVFGEQLVTPLYRYKNETLIEMFGITPAEQREMRTIIGKDEYRKRHAARDTAKRRERGQLTREEYEGQAAAKAAKARELKAQGLSVRQIAAAMGVSVGAVSGYLKESAESPVA